MRFECRRVPRARRLASTREILHWRQARQVGGAGAKFLEIHVGRRMDAAGRRRAIREVWTRSRQTGSHGWCCLARDGAHGACLPRRQAVSRLGAAAAGTVAMTIARAHSA